MFTKNSKNNVHCHKKYKTTHMSGELPIKIYPTIDECKIKTQIKCPMEGCESIFKSESNLKLHLSKTHKDVEATKSMQCSDKKLFYCPESECNKYYKNLRTLRQHYRKIHMEKSYLCDHCNGLFVSEKAKLEHAQYCGVKFSCGDCDASYDLYETLQTHCRRKQHKILNKKSFIGGARNNIKYSKKDTKCILNNKRGLLLPKNVKDTYVFFQTGDTVSNKIDQGSQTYITSAIKDTTTVETQTSHISYSNVISNELLSSCSAVQTDVIESRTSSCNTPSSFNLDDLYFSNVNTATEVQKSSIHTQTQRALTSTAFDLLTDDFDTTFFNCHMETQTDNMVLEQSHHMFYNDFCSNTYTQTCEEILSGVGLCDSHTQTTYGDSSLRSVESQTAISQLKCSHMETQTDLRQMLEIINS